MRSLKITLVALLPASAAAQWTRVTQLPVYDVASVTLVGSTLYAGSDSSIYVSTDAGDSWSALPPISSAQEFIVSFTVYNGRMFAGTWNHGVFTSSNNGGTWQQINTGFSGPGSLSCIGFIEHQGSLIAGTQGAGTYKLNGDMVSWTAFGDLPLNNSGTVYCMTVRGDTATIGAGSNGIVYRLFPDSTTWLYQDFTGGVFKPATSFAWLGQELFAGTTFGAYRSSDNGGSWEFAGNGLLTALECYITALGMNLYAWLNDLGGAYFCRSTDRGENWQVIDPLPGLYGYGLTAYGNKVFAARGDGLWYYPVSVTEVGRGDQVPGGFAVSQNYPNPFNGIANFGLSIADWSDVRLSVYDLLGREVAVLLNERKGPGSYTVQWDSGRAPSGVYFVRMEAGSVVKIVRAALVR